MEKINVAEILKDCPSGMELDCTIYDNCTFETIENINCTKIIINTPNGQSRLSKEGCFIHDDEHAKCVIFPKGKTTWEGFQRPFKDGDIIYNRLQRRICIYHYREDETPCIGYFRYNEYNKTFEILNDDICIAKQDYRFATEEEKEKLFKAIQDNGYKWNVETKTLEIAPKFKVGDIIQDKDGYKMRITKVNTDDALYEYESLITKGIGVFAFIEQDYLKLVQNKFDISTLKPFDSRVLVRNSDGEWRPGLYTSSDSEGCYVVSHWKQCIPYEGNENLLGTTNDCDDFYKN